MSDVLGPGELARRGRVSLAEPVGDTVAAEVGLNAGFRRGLETLPTPRPRVGFRLRVEEDGGGRVMMFDGRCFDNLAPPPPPCTGGKGECAREVGGGFRSFMNGKSPLVVLEAEGPGDVGLERDEYLVSGLGIVD